MPDASALIPLLQTGQYDQYMKGLIEDTYGRAGVSPYMRDALMRNAPNIARQAQMRAVVDNPNADMGALLDTNLVQQAMQEAMTSAHGGGPMMRPDQAQTGVRFLERLAQLSQEDPTSPGGMLAEVVYNDPQLLQQLTSSMVPQGYGGIFGKGLRQELGNQIQESYYQAPKSGNYLTDLANMMAQFNSIPRSTPDPVQRTNPIAQAVVAQIADNPETIDREAVLAELDALAAQQ